MKFKIGDIVRISPNVVNVDKEEMEGMLGRVTGVNVATMGLYRIELLHKNSFVLTCERWLEPMNKIKKAKMKIASVAYNGKEVKVFLSNGAVGIARCHPEDKFDMSVGFKIAYERAEAQFIPSFGDNYYLPSPTAVYGKRGEKLVAPHTWRDTEADKAYFNRGMVFKTKEEARKAAEKMLAALKN